MTHDENRISDLIDGGLHDKSAIDRAKYELHMRQRAAIEEAAEKARIDNIVCLTGKAKEAFRMGAKEVIYSPEKYKLISYEDANQLFDKRADESAMAFRKIRDELEAENQRLREALERIDAMASDRLSDFAKIIGIVAKEALKNNDK